MRCLRFALSEEPTVGIVWSRNIKPGSDVPLMGKKAHETFWQRKFDAIVPKEVKQHVAVIDDVVNEAIRPAEDAMIVSPHPFKELLVRER